MKTPELSYSQESETAPTQVPSGIWMDTDMGETDTVECCSAFTETEILSFATATRMNLEDIMQIK